MADKFIEMTTEIVASYVGSNKVPASELPALIAVVQKALQQTEAPAAEEPQLERLTASQIRRSIRPDGLVSFEDGKTYKTLKRHLTKRGLTVADYKTKWGLPSDYPVVASEYAERRSMLAKAAGLGQGGRGASKPKAPGRKKK